MILDELVKFSNSFGSDEELVLAGGGNTSGKDGNVMYVKGSGTRLSTITGDGFVKMDRSLLADIFKKEYPLDDAQREACALSDLMAARMPGEEGKRPSVETTLHSLFEQTFVLHLHPALVNGLTCGINGEKTARELFGDDFVWVDLCKPGYVLAKLCKELMEAQKAKTGKPVNTVILQNHGIFLASDEADSLGELLGRVLTALKARVKRFPNFEYGYPDVGLTAEYMKAVEAYNSELIPVFETGADAVEYSRTPEAAEVLMKPFTPDHIVYCKANPLFCGAPGELSAGIDGYVKKYGYMPKIVIAGNCGFFSLDKTESGAMTAAEVFKDAVKIAVYSESFGGALHMTDELTDFIVNWEVESYRSKQNK